MESVIACQNIQPNSSPSKNTLSINMQQFQPSCHLLKHSWQSPFQRTFDSCNTPFSIIGTSKYPFQLKVIFISSFNPFHNQGITATSQKCDKAAQGRIKSNNNVSKQQFIEKYDTIQYFSITDIYNHIKLCSTNEQKIFRMQCTTE